MRFLKTVLGIVGFLVLLTALTDLVATTEATEAANETEIRQATPAPQTVPAAPVLRLRVGTFDPRRRLPPIATEHQRTIPNRDPTLHLIQFPGPIQEMWVEAIKAAGLEIVIYIPDYAYLVWGTAEGVQTLSRRTPLRWHGDYAPGYAIHPALQARQRAAAAPITVTVQLYDQPDAEATLADIRNRARRVVRPPVTVRGLTNVAVEIDATELTTLASLPAVVSIEPTIVPQRLDEVQGQLVAGNVTLDGSRPSAPGYLAWLTETVGFTTTASAYPIVDITDDGIDDGDASPQHPDFYTAGDMAQPDRLAYNINWTSDASADGAGGHGNLNAAIVGGYNARSGFPYEDTNGYNYGLGINPFGPIAGSKVFQNVGPWDAPSYETMVSTSYNAGARILSNSWGDTPGQGNYVIDDQIYDALVRDADPTTAGEQPITIVFAAGNSGASGSGTIGSPANAKNVITVGAAESYRPTWWDGCGVSANGADNANDMAGFSSRGPVSDGRIKPDIVAPGTHIQGAATQTPNYTGAFICDPYHPSGQTLYAASSGTSHATPAVAGAASLLTRFHQDRFSASPPSPAMIKAYLINAARYLEGVGSGGTLPSNSQGFGGLDIGRAFDTTPRMIADQSQVFHATGESTVMQGVVADSSRPFRVTLAWTDAPGPTTGDAYVNDLDLVVSVGGQTYLGNVFSGAYATTGGSSDPRNNVESVFLPSGLQGAFTITVTATNLPGDGVPGDADITDQDYALVCYNCQDSSDLVLKITPTALDLCRPDTGVYTITPTAATGITGPVILSVSGLPGDTLSSLTPNPVALEEASRLTITTTAQTPVGNTVFEITGATVSLTATVSANVNIQAPPQNAAPLLSPTDTVTGVVTTPTLAWMSVSEATGYAVAVAEDPAFTTIVYTATTAATDHTVTRRLLYETTYYWRITGANGCGAGDPSETWQFTTGPALALDVMPTTLSTCRHVGARYTVTATSADAGSPITLSVTGTPTDAATSLMPNPLTAGQAGSLTITPTLLSPPGDYTLTIEGQTPTASLTTTAGLTVQSLPSLPPTPISPTGGITGVATTPTLTWSPLADATAYRVQIATEATPAAFESPTTRVYSVTTVATRHTVTQALLPGEIYYWRVSGINGCGTGSPSAAEGFAVTPPGDLIMTPATLTLCRGNSGRYTVTVPAETALDGPITLAVRGIPSNTSAAFTQNPILAAEASELIITSSAQTPIGDHLLRITGTAAGETGVATATLRIVTPPQAVTRLLAPADALTEVSPAPKLAWDPVPGATQYTVVVATDAAFVTPALVTATTGTSLTVAPPLQSGTTYYWRVTSANACGSGAPSLPRSFMTQVYPYRLYLPVYFIVADT